MPDYINPPLDVDPADIEDEVYTYIQSFFPNWEPRESHLVVVITEAFALQVATNRRLISDVPASIFRYFGSLLGVQFVEAEASTGFVTITAIDNAGYTYEAGLTMRIHISGESYWTFATDEEVIIPPGSTTAVGVAITAVTEGQEGNALTEDPDLLDFEDSILSVTLDGPTEGGQDEQDEDDYNNKLVDRLQLLKDGPVKPVDFEIFTTTLFPDVHRALCLNLYNPDTDTFGNEKTITIVPVDREGAALPALHAAISDAMEDAREFNFVCKVMAPTYNAITIDVNFTVNEGWVPAQALIDVQAAIAAYLHPRSWGIPNQKEDRVWKLDGWEKVRYLEVATVVNNAEAVNYINSLSINGLGAGVDFTMVGRAPLPAAIPTINAVAA